MRIHKKENTTLTETANRDNVFANFRKDIMNVVEMYNEDMLEDDEDVFGGTEDSYAVEMLFQHLFDTLHETIKDKYLSKDAAMNTASDLTNYLAEFIIKGEPYEIENAIKTVYDKYIKVNSTNEGETFTFSQEVLDKVNAELEKSKPELIDEIKKEFREFKAILKDYDFTNEEINALPETKAYKAAIRDPEDIWCTCSGETNTKFKPDGTVYLGVYKHGAICTNCKKYSQIG